MPSQETTGLPSNLAGAAAYLLFFVTGIVFLVIEKKDGFVRFHAMQSTLTFGGLFILQLIFAQMWYVSSLPNQILTPLGLILWIILMFKAYSGERYKLPYLGDFAEQQLGKMR